MYTLLIWQSSTDGKTSQVLCFKTYKALREAVERLVMFGWHVLEISEE